MTLLRKAAHSYTIMTTPVVVASWISLQYFGSAGAPFVFMAGNKLLHNVAGGIGVVDAPRWFALAVGVQWRKAWLHQATSEPS